MARTSDYQKTAARWRGFLLGGSAWLGSDHLLSVRSMRFSEEYRRYYYRDIQALQMRRGPRWWCPSWLIGMLLLLALAAIFFSVARRFTWAGACELTMVASLGLIAYQSLARGCYCYIVTAVATEEITGIRSVATARQTMAAIADRVTAVQGGLAEGWEESSRLMATASGPSRPLPWKETDAPMAIGDEVAAPALGVWSAVAAVLSTLADGIITLGEMRHWPMPGWLGMTNVSIGMAAIVLAILLLRGVRQLHWLRNLALASVLVMGSATYLAYLLSTMMNNVPSGGRGVLNQLHQGLGVFNIAGDLGMVATTATLWLRRRPRDPAAASLASTGEF